MSKMKMVNLKSWIAFTALLLYGADLTWGQGQEQYMKTMNSLVPGTPEATSIMKSIDFPVSLFTGQPNINIPISGVSGKGISVPVSISYAATNGIKVNEIATNVGLGFVLSGGGEITREVRGTPDEGNNISAGLFSNSATILDYEGLINSNTSQGKAIAKQAASGTLDLEPDLFYFSLPGASGKYMYDDESGEFVCTQLQPYKISFNATDKTWKIIGPDGTTYLFDKKVLTATQQYCNLTVPVTNAYPVTTSWKLTRIINADKTDSIQLEYENSSYYYYSEGSSIKYQLAPQSLTTPRPSMDCFNRNNISGWNTILRIASCTDTVTFQYASTMREDMPPLSVQYPLEKIIYTNGNEAAKTIFKLEYGYYNRQQLVGDYNTQNDTDNRKSLRLDRMTNYGNSESNVNPLKWNFFYDNENPLPARLSYAQDWWGYYNNNDVTHTLVPKGTQKYSNGAEFFVDGADRIPYPEYTGAGMLKMIQFPTGGTTSFEFEPNEVGYKVPFSNVNTEIVSIDTMVGNALEYGDWIPAGETYEKTFTVNEDPDPYANYNNPNGGAYVTIDVDPIQIPTAPNGNYNNNDIYFELSGTGTFKIIANENHIENFYLPNGTFTIRVINAARVNYMPYYHYGPDGDTPYGGEGSPSLRYAIKYEHIPKNAHGIINRQLGGMRIKSIVSTDSIGNTRTVKRYGYRDPVTDSSYGFFTGTTFHTSVDYLVKNGGWVFNTNAYKCDFYTFGARHGNSIMPGAFSLGATVVYPKVFEYTIDGNLSYKTEYHYSYFIPTFNSDFPFVPPFLNESSHGNLLMSKAYRTSGINYLNAKTVKNTYDFSPGHFDNPGTGFARAIKGVRSAFAGFSDDPAGCPFEYVFSNAYVNWINYAQIDADSTITYDLNNEDRSIKVWHDYAYGDYNHLPLITRTGNSDGTVDIEKVWYAADQPESNTNVSSPTNPIPQMVTTNRVSQPLGIKQYKETQLLGQQYTYCGFDGNKLLIDSVAKGLFSNPLETELKVPEYDAKGNPLTVEMRGGKYRRYIWNTAKNLALATCVMPGNVRFAFTSFEYPNEYSWHENSRILTDPFSGKYAYRLAGGDIVMPPFSTITHGSAEVDVYVWATDATFSINGNTPQSTGKAKGSYTLYHARLVTANTFTLSSGDASLLIDQLVVIPVGSQFQGNVYDSSNRVIATVNDQIMTSFFEYDNFGRLKTVRDEQGNILKTSDYQYQGLQ